MDGRWRCESEGLTRRTNPRTGRTEWVEQMPACHGPMRPDWLRCSVCGFACRHWTCQTCQAELRTPLHVCDPDAGSREVDPHRR